MKTTTTQADEKRISQYLEAVAERAVRTHCASCGIQAIEDWASRWLSAEDRTEPSATEAGVLATAVEAWPAAVGARVACWAAKAAARSETWPRAARMATMAAKAAASLAGHSVAAERNWLLRQARENDLLQGKQTNVGVQP